MLNNMGNLSRYNIASEKTRILSLSSEIKCDFNFLFFFFNLANSLKLVCTILIMRTKWEHGQVFI